MSVPNNREIPFLSLIEHRGNTLIIGGNDKYDNYIYNNIGTMRRTVNIVRKGAITIHIIVQ